jgi:hypothetical protein
MEQSSQGQARRAPRPWTDEDQRRAEELRAQGLSYRAIGSAIGRSNVVVRRRLNVAVAEKHNADSRRWREANLDLCKERRRRDRRRRFEMDPEREREQTRAWRRANPERVREIGRDYRRANNERHRSNQRRWRQAHPEKVREYDRRQRSRFPERVRETTRRRRARVRAAGRRSLVPLTPAQARLRFKLFSDACAYCGASDRITVDHVLALTAGGLDEAQNIVPACVSCNCSKRAKAVEGWYRCQPFFTEGRWQRLRRHCPGIDAGQLPLALLPSTAA